MTIKTVFQTTEQYGTSTERSAMRTSDIADGHRIVFRETDTGAVYEYFGTGWEKVGTAGAVNAYESSVGAGDEGVGSPTLSRKRTNNRANCTKLAAVATAQNIGGAANIPVYIKAIRLFESMTAAATVTIAGLSTPTTVASLSTTLVIPAITVTNGVPVDIFPPGIARAFPAGCQITFSTATDADACLVEWEEIP